MTAILANSTVKTENLKVGDLARKIIANKPVDFIILAIEKSQPGERDFKLKVAAPESSFLNAPHSYYAFASDEWENVGQVDVDEYWRNLNKKKPIEQAIDQGKYDYLEAYNERVSSLQQLSLAENDARIETYNQRDWWGNPLTSHDMTEHLWNLYQRTEETTYKLLYLKMFAERKGMKLPPYDRDTLGFPLFTEEKIKELESLHNA